MIVTAWQDRDRRARPDREIDDDVGQSAARMSRDDHVGRGDIDAFEWCRLERDAVRETRPGLDHHVVQPRVGWRQGRIHDDSLG